MLPGAWPLSGRCRQAGWLGAGGASQGELLHERVAAAILLAQYYGGTVPRLVSPVMGRADVHVQHDERWQVTAVDYRDRRVAPPRRSR